MEEREGQDSKLMRRGEEKVTMAKRGRIGEGKNGRSGRSGANSDQRCEDRSKQAWKGSELMIWLPDARSGVTDRERERNSMAFFNNSFLVMKKNQFVFKFYVI